VTPTRKRAPGLPAPAANASAARRAFGSGISVRYVKSVARNAGIIALFIVAAILGILSGVIFAYTDDLPEISALDNYAPSTITRIYAADGTGIVGEFATQRRLVIGYDDMAPHLRQAIIAAEDGGFNQHFGLSVSSIAIRASKEVLQGIQDRMVGRRSRPAGASTLTQQLARNLLPETVGFRIGVNDVSPERKIKEAIVALQIEKRYTKPEILTFYANHMLFGHGTYGVEAASRLYFGKSAKDVTLEEAALLAGILQSPARQSPFVSLDAATGRRNYALQRMADEGFITRAEAEAAKETPILVQERPQQNYTVSPHFLENVRRHLEARYGARQLYESGLAVTTTLDVSLQRAANEAMARGLRRLDKRRGFRRPEQNVLADGKTIEEFRHSRWARAMRVGDVVPAVVVTLGDPAPATGARLQIGSRRADLTREGFAWTGRPSAASLFKTGDLIEVEITKLDEEAGVAEVRLEQTPLVEGALVAVENRTGHIKAMVGGWDFDRSKFNRAVQAYRQLGSTFKPIVYTAAIDRGFTPVSILDDSPATWTSDIGEVYAPENYDHKYEGPVTLRHALEQSRNIPALRMMETLSPNTVVGYAKRFGFAQDFPPYLAIALGAGDSTLLEVTSAYSAFPNQGVRMKPLEVLKVLDRDGNLLEENRTESVDVIRADTAFVMLDMMRGVVQRGTAAAAASLDWPLAGKTGTVDDNTDAWFVGFDPNITVGVWVGLDEKKSLGRTETGGVAALPIWMDFMRAYIESRQDRETPPQFEAPGNIVFLPVNRVTGGVTEPGSSGAITEAFIAGTQPGGLQREH
jgi:penicillin-binding protein 1A